MSYHILQVKMGSCYDLGMDKEMLVLLLEAVQRIEEKLDALIYDVDQDDSPVGPYGRERDNGEVL